jgi:hypothetical protein
MLGWMSSFEFFAVQHGGPEHGDAQHAHTKVGHPRSTIANST